MKVMVTVTFTEASARFLTSRLRNGNFRRAVSKVTSESTQSPELKGLPMWRIGTATKWSFDIMANIPE